MHGFDRSSYDYYYDNGIRPLMEEYQQKYENIVVNPNARELIWNTYTEFNRHCKSTYMSSDVHLLDRHKVVACYMYAIERSYVISSVESLRAGDLTNLYLNENLSVTFGLSLLRALIIDAVEAIDETEKRKKEIKSAFDGDIELPDCNHGIFKDNLMSQLRFTHEEGNYNILSLAETLYLIECFNLVRKGFSSDEFKISKRECS